MHMKFSLFGIWCLVLGIFLSGCGSGSIVDTTQNNTDENADGTSLNLAPSEKIYVAAAFFTDPVGSIATVGMSNPYPVQKAKAVTDSSDVVVRSFDNKLFVINRGITSTIQAIDPDSFKILGNYSVEPSSNPQALVVANGKAFISRYDSNLADDNKDDLWIVDPLSGSRSASIDLKPFTTNDSARLARASEMALVGDFLYVLMQDLSLAFKADTNGKVAVIDTRTNEIVDVDASTAGTQVIELSGRNPTSIVYHSGSNRLLITDTGVFNSNFLTDVNTSYGGIEIVNPATNTTQGILIDDKDFGGYLSSVALSGDTAAVTVSAEKVALFNASTLAITNASLYTSPSRFIPELLFDKNGLLWVPERDPTNDGMIVVDPATASVVSGPNPVGALPASMALIK